MDIRDEFSHDAIPGEMSAETPNLKEVFSRMPTLAETFERVLKTYDAERFCEFMALAYMIKNGDVPGRFLLAEDAEWLDGMSTAIRPGDVPEISVVSWRGDRRVNIADEIDEQRWAPTPPKEGNRHERRKMAKLGGI